MALCNIRSPKVNQWCMLLVFISASSSQELGQCWEGTVSWNPPMWPWVSFLHEWQGKETCHCCDSHTTEIMSEGAPTWYLQGIFVRFLRKRNGNLTYVSYVNKNSMAHDKNMLTLGWVSSVSTRKVLVLLHTVPKGLPAYRNSFLGCAGVSGEGRKASFHKQLLTMLWLQPNTSKCLCQLHA